MDDLKIIKDNYGEKMSKFCRKSFPTLLEIKGLLPNLLLSKFAPNHFLYDDIVNNKIYYDDCEYDTIDTNSVDSFINYILSLVETVKNNATTNKKTPSELLSEAGYYLYQCKSEEDIEKFRKYYRDDAIETLCTFKLGNRLSRCMVFFAVKKNVDEIKRENFLIPKRQDEYGTSVLSIQFTRGSHILSIKNRYNHRVPNADATFSNNLDNIILGLTESFAREYNLKLSRNNVYFELPNYIFADDNRSYKYNYEINNIYYCPNNTIIDHGKIIKFDKSTKLLLDYFVLDLQNKKIELYDKNIKDSFFKEITNIKKITILKIEKGKRIIIKPNEGEDIIIEIDKCNRIVKYNNNNIKHIENNFLYYNKSLVEIKIPKVKYIENNFLYFNEDLKYLSIPEVKVIGNNFLYINRNLTDLKLLNVEKIGNNFLYFNNSLLDLELFNIEVIGDKLLYFNRTLKSLNIPNVNFIGKGFLCCNTSLNNLIIPREVQIGDQFLCINPCYRELLKMKIAKK